eukprot:TRINITY_DN21654_c0_g1_i1.p1 TRINITY_DN21654_c0_g1~~TRINITY_DN21654_c0_g1_i1.p1  ORF type:complete len:493 (+),score=60.33 TRINITY_DN21654_c0_g1_i1:180-1481(+)
MPPTNVFSLVQARKRGEARRSRLWEAQLTMLRLRERWSFNDSTALPWGAASVKDVVPLDADIFCVVSKSGHADVYTTRLADDSEHRSNEENGPRLHWLLDLRVFAEERVRLVSHIRCGSAILVVFSISDRRRRHAGNTDPPRYDPTTLFVRVLDAVALRRGELQPRDCGTLSSVVVPAGGFVEVDDQNEGIFVCDCDTLRCWDARSFQPRFTLGPWEDGMPNIRFTRGFLALMRGTEVGVEIRLRRLSDGGEVARREVSVPNVEVPIVFLELLNEIAMLKWQGSEVIVVDLFGDGPPISVPGTSAWEPEVFVFVPSQRLALAKRTGAVELWKAARADSCRLVGIVSMIDDFAAGRFSVDERLAAFLVACRGVSEPQDGDNLLLLDLARCGGLSAALLGAGQGSSGVASVWLDLGQGLLVLRSRNGGLSAYSVT